MADLEEINRGAMQFGLRFEANEVQGHIWYILYRMEHGKEEHLGAANSLDQAVGFVWGYRVGFQAGEEHGYQVGMRS